MPTKTKTVTNDVVVPSFWHLGVLQQPIAAIPQSIESVREYKTNHIM